MCVASQCKCFSIFLHQYYYYWSWSWSHAPWNFHGERSTWYLPWGLHGIARAILHRFSVQLGPSFITQTPWNRDRYSAWLPTTATSMITVSCCSSRVNRGGLGLQTRIFGHSKNSLLTGHAPHVTQWTTSKHWLKQYTQHVMNYKTDSVHMDVFTTSKACCDLDLWPPKFNEVIVRGWWIFPVSFIKTVQGNICPEERTNERMDGQTDRCSEQTAPQQTIHISQTVKCRQTTRERHTASK